MDKIEIVLIDDNNRVVYKEERNYSELGSTSIVIWNNEYYVFRLVRNHFKQVLFVRCNAPTQL